MTNIVSELEKKNLKNITNEKKRNCPSCGKELFYKTKCGFDKANSNNSKCHTCSSSGENNGFYGKKHSKQLKSKFSKERKSWYIGKDNPMYKQSVYDLWVKKYGKDVADEKQKIANHKNKLSNDGENNGFYGKKHSKQLKSNFSKNRIGKTNPNHGNKHTEEWKENQRKRTIQRIKEFTQGKIGFNPNACKYLDRLNEERGWNLQHALNGGEVECIGYSLDGYDKKRNIVVEYDEPLHNKPTQRKKDILRMNRIKKYLHCKFYRYNEETNELKKYE